jgi:hypothetical protein
MNTLPSWAQQLARALSLPAAGRTSRAPPPGGTRPGTRSRRGRRSAGAAAWLHDIGYPPGLAVTGLHALDGARYLRDAQQAAAMLCRLVAPHCCAIVEAGERGIAGVLSLEVEPAPYALSTVLTCCDMTTSLDGELVPAGRRLAGIQHRNGPGHLVSRSIQRATPMILTAVEQVNDRAA